MIGDTLRLRQRDSVLVYFTTRNKTQWVNNVDILKPHLKSRFAAAMHPDRGFGHIVGPNYQSIADLLTSLVDEVAKKTTDEQKLPIAESNALTALKAITDDRLAWQAEIDNINKSTVISAKVFYNVSESMSSSVTERIYVVDF